MEKGLVVAGVRDGAEEGKCEDEGAIAGDLCGDGVALYFNCGCGYTNLHVDKIALHYAPNTHTQMSTRKTDGM